MQFCAVCVRLATICAPQLIAPEKTFCRISAILPGIAEKKVTIWLIHPGTFAPIQDRILEPHSWIPEITRLNISAIRPGICVKKPTALLIAFEAPELIVSCKLLTHVCTAVNAPESLSGMLFQKSTILSPIPLKNSPICSQLSLITITSVATAATIPATTAATTAGAPKITAPTAAIAIPSPIRISLMIENPFWNISTKLVIARMLPPITAEIPPNATLKVPKNPQAVFIKADNEPLTAFVTVDITPPSCGKFFARFFAVFANVLIVPMLLFKTPVNPVTVEVTAFAECIAIKAVAIRPSPSPSALSASGLMPFNASNTPFRTFETPPITLPMLSTKPDMKPSKRAETPGNSSDNPSQKPFMMSFAACTIRGAFSLILRASCETARPAALPISLAFPAIPSNTFLKRVTPAPHKEPDTLIKALINLATTRPAAFVNSLLFPVMLSRNELINRSAESISFGVPFSILVASVPKTSPALSTIASNPPLLKASCKAFTIPVASCTTTLAVPVMP